ncbi:hypothetical protein VB773_13750 [Haloarculaceae archaeon H-GB2-1]|nr:hypothetical protein [Haloarculaceae archaeon H-GB1-1]MEA5387027.1 hypothetical protein [Haloarculaceae archaeon H-GB11]MEA5408528.1 hypothetical protein [Haloarculaceae archaeon H-GB2-1]
MRAVTTQLAEKAQSIFADLGYTVSRDGPEFRAERKWRVVYVTASADPESIPERGDYRCFVTWSESVTDLRSRLERVEPDYEWAVIGVEDRDADEYEVHTESTAA